MAALALAILLLVAGGSSALAGTWLEFEARDHGGDRPLRRRGVIDLEPDRMRLDVSEESTSVVYRADLDQAWVLYHRDRSFFRVSRAALDDLSRTMAEAMPPELRAAMERTLGKALGPAPAEATKLSLRKTGRKERVNGVGCAELELRNGEEILAVACTADWKSVAVDPETFRPIQKLGPFLRSILSVTSVFRDVAVRAEDLDVLDAVGRLDGVPARIQILDTGRPIRELTVRSIERRSFGADTFEIPAGYQQRAIPLP
jgi:hypothetical protein